MLDRKVTQTMVRKCSSHIESRTKSASSLTGVSICETGRFPNLAKLVSMFHARRHQQSTSTGQLGTGQRFPQSSWQGCPLSSPPVFLSKCVFTALVISKSRGDGAEGDGYIGETLIMQNLEIMCGHFIHLNSISSCPSEGRGWVE